MRIAHITATFPPYKGGTGNVCFYNAIELAHRGHDVHVFTPHISRTATYEINNGITIHRLKSFVHVGNAAFLPQLLFQLKGFDVIHLHYPCYGGEFSALAAKLTNTPLIITYHHDVILSGILGSLEKIIRITIEYATLRSARKLLFTTSDYEQESHIRSLLKGRENIIGILPNGVDIQMFSPGKPPSELYRQFHITPKDRIVILVAGLDRAHYFKGVPIFLKAIAQLPPDIKGLIVGDGDLKPSYERLAEELGLSERIFFVGRVANGTLQDYYRLANVTVLPSVTRGEAFGLVLLESMSCGIPVIASNLPGVRTVITDQEDGILVPPGDVNELASVIQGLLNNPELCIHMGQAGCQKVVMDYNWSKIARTLESVYVSVLSH